MEQTTINQSDSVDLAKPIPLVLCPDCKRRIPILLLKPKNIIYFKCSCLNVYKSLFLPDFIKSLYTNQPQPIGEEHQCTQHLKQTQKYCLNCLAWLCTECLPSHSGNDHVLSEFELRIECSQHHKPFSYYCKQCMANACDDCEQHQRHKAIPLIKDSYEKDEPKLNITSRIMIKNRRLTKRLQERIDNHIELLRKMKENIQLACEANERINKDLILLYQSLNKTSQAFISYPSYELMRLKSIVLNPKEYSEPRRCVEVQYATLREHFKRNYVVKQTVANKYFSTLTQWMKVHCLLQLNDGRLASTSHSNILLWDISTYVCVGSFTGHSGEVTCLVQLNNERLASGSEDATIKIWNIKSEKSTATLMGHNEKVACLLQLNDGRLASCGNDATLKLWNATTYECIATLTMKYGIDCLLQLKDGSLLLNHYDLYLYHPTTLKAIDTIEMDNSVACFIQLRDGRLAIGTYNWEIYLFNVVTLKYITTLTGHKDSVTCLVELNDGRLASGSEDSTIKLWSIPGNGNILSQCMTTLLQRNEAVTCLVQLKNGMLASNYHWAINLWSLN